MMDSRKFHIDHSSRRNAILEGRVVQCLQTSFHTIKVVKFKKCKPFGSTAVLVAAVPDGERHQPCEVPSDGLLSGTVWQIS